MWTLIGLGILLLGIVLFDLLQRKHAILRNFPLVGHFRYLLEAIGPELRQYIVTDNNSERPFSRDQRRWVYSTSKKENDYFGFGTDNDLDLTPNYLIIKHSVFPLPSPHPQEPGYDPRHTLPCAKILGGHRQRRKAFRPSSLLMVSAMSFGSISGPAVEALNRGCRIAGALHNTGEGGISPHHLHGAELVWQVGTGYFGCRNPDGTFSRERLQEKVAAYPQIKAIEIKLSQGAKAGLGGIVPAVKVTAEVAAIRGVPQGKDCLSPPYHTAFKNADGLLDFVEEIADLTGLPVGIKSAVGDLGFWNELGKAMSTSGRAVDFITIDGGEGGTGAAPLAFADHVSLPFKQGFSRVYCAMGEFGLLDKLVFIGAGKLGFPETAVLGLALGCDMLAVAREAMLSIGCIQAQRCQTGHCPSGVATQNRWLMHGLDPTLKSARLANYLVTLRKEILRLCRSCGVEHPALLTPDHLEICDGHLNSRPLRDVFGYPPDLGLPTAEQRQAIRDLMAGNIAIGIESHG